MFETDSSRCFQKFECSMFTIQMRSILEAINQICTAHYSTFNGVSFTCEMLKALIRPIYPHIRRYLPYVCTFIHI